MRKIWNIVFVAFAAAAFTVACTKASELDVTKEEVPQGEQKEGHQARPMTITATIPADIATKVNFTPDVASGKLSSMQLTWQATDVLRVYNHADKTKYADFELKSGADLDVAIFGCDDVSALDGATSYDVEINASVANFAEQTQASNGNTEHLKYLASVTDISDYSSVSFTELSSVLAIVAKMPSQAVAATITSVDITASADIFNGGNTLRINISDAGSTNDILNLYATLPQGNQAIVAGTTLLVRFNSSNEDHTVYTRYIVLPAQTFNAGKLNTININASQSDKHAGVCSGENACDGSTAAKAYLIGDKYQMDAIHDLMVAGSTTYFKLIDNIDMTGISWVGLNNTATGGKFNKYIYFDGNNKTVSNLTPDVSKDYPSLFGVLQGSVKDLTIDHFTASSVGAKKCGAFAGYIGTGTDYTGDKTIDNVHVTNSSISGGTNYCGGFAGQMNRAGYNITNCTVEDTDITSSSYAAGFIAYIQEIGTISDIIVKGCNVKSTGYANSGSVPSDGFAGGIAARVDAAVDFDRCYYQKNTTTNRTATITGPKNDGSDNGKKSRYIGGIVGYVKNVAATFDDCHVNTVTLALNEAGSNNNGRYMGGAFGYIGSSVKVGESNACTVTAISADKSTNYTRNYVAGFIGYNDGGTIKNSSASGSIVSSGGLGGFVAVSNGGSFVDCSSSVEISGAGNLGGFVGIAETSATIFTRCSAGGSVTATANYSGGFAGLIKSGTITKCSATGGASSTGNFVGGFAGGIGEQGCSVTISKTMASGEVSGVSTVGGLVAYAINGTLEISDSYSTCNLQSNARRRGGLIAWVENGNVTVSNCYASGTIDGSFEMGGLVGLVSVSSLNMSKSAAWNTRITATSRAANNWSSAAVVGVTYLTCTLTDNYRNPNMDSLIYWGTNAECSINLPNTFQHPDVSTSAPLTDPDGNAVTSSTMRPYQGKCDASKTLSELASTTLGWSPDVWDFTGGDLPTLK